MHATAAVAARQLPGVCTFALQPTKQRENANWSRIAQLTRSDRKASALARCGSCWAIIDRVRDSEPRGAGPAASEAVWTAERTNAFNKLYLQTDDSRLLPLRRRGRTTCTPRGTRCRSVARSHLIPVYRPPHRIVQCNSRRRAASPFPSITKILSVVVECLCGPAGPSVDRRTSTPSTRHPSHV